MSALIAAALALTCLCLHAVQRGTTDDNDEDHADHRGDDKHDNHDSGPPGNHDEGKNNHAGPDLPLFCLPAVQRGTTDDNDDDYHGHEDGHHDDDDDPNICL